MLYDGLFIKDRIISKLHFQITSRKDFLCTRIYLQLNNEIGMKNGIYWKHSYNWLLSLHIHSSPNVPYFPLLSLLGTDRSHMERDLANKEDLAQNYLSTGGPNPWVELQKIVCTLQNTHTCHSIINKHLF